MGEGDEAVLDDQVLADGAEELGPVEGCFLRDGKNLFFRKTVAGNGNEAQDVLDERFAEVVFIIGQEYLIESPMLSAAR